MNRLSPSSSGEQLARSFHRCRLSQQHCTFASYVGSKVPAEHATEGDVARFRASLPSSMPLEPLVAQPLSSAAWVQSGAGRLVAQVSPFILIGCILGGRDIIQC